MVQRGGQIVSSDTLLMKEDQRKRNAEQPRHSPTPNLLTNGMLRIVCSSLPFLTNVQPINGRSLNQRGTSASQETIEGPQTFWGRHAAREEGRDSEGFALRYRKKDRSCPE